MIKFKEHFNIPSGQPVEFLDIPMDEDLLVFIDPFLIANNKQAPILRDIYAQTGSFFEKLNRDYVVPNNVSQGLSFLGNLHEPNEYHLGYSGSNKGKAISGTRATTIFGALRNNMFARTGVTITNDAHNVLLLVGGIGQDIMSDTIANVCRNIFATFTTNQCVKHNISTSKFSRHYYTAVTGLWDLVDFDLPSYKGKPIILLPQSIASYPKGYTNSYNRFVAGNYIAQDILSGKIKVTHEGKYIMTRKDGTRRPLINQILETYRKPKAKLFEFVIEYNDSLTAFLDHVKEHYPGIDLSGI
jgi:hypothetical protein